MKTSTHRIPGLVLSDHFFSLPLDHSRPAGEQVQVFAREVAAAGREQETLPWLVFLQGGPGFPAPRPLGSQGWIQRALQDYRLLLLDQRGTGRSTPLTFQTLARFTTPQAAANCLKFFRADAIVRDAEAIRRVLLGVDQPWSVLGQSFGGFCLLTYLSLAPDGLREGLFTGGLPSIHRSADEIYRAAYRRVLAKNKQFYQRYPEDANLAQEIVTALSDHPVFLPGGDRLTPRRFQQLGWDFGANDGFEKLHYLLEEAFVPVPDGRELSYTFLRSAEAAHSFDTNPLYALLHEAIYCQGAASRWSAQRVRSEFPEFEPVPGQPLLFSGEMVYPWMFSEWQKLQPLQEIAHILAEYDGWPSLYDPVALSRNTVPCAAVIYYNDMYVERLHSEETAQSVPNLHTWVTSEYEHNGLRMDGEVILGRLIDMLRGRV